MMNNLFFVMEGESERRDDGRVDPAMHRRREG